MEPTSTITIICLYRADIFVEMNEYNWEEIKKVSG